MPPFDRRDVFRLLLTVLISALWMPCLVEGPPVEQEVPKVYADSNALQKRQNSPAGACKRWSQQSAIINGTLYLYGGRAILDSEQTSNTWNNDFLSLPLTTTWQISSLSLTGLPRPSGPPPVANGYLWASYDALYLYGGEFSDNPPTSPTPFSLWEYQVASATWIEHTSPVTSAGVNAPDAGVAVERAAEGAGFSVAALGRGWYFGGHEDGYTTNGWSQSIPRIYLTSLLEYTFPGYTNGQVQSLSDGSRAGSGGVWRNITQGAVENPAGFPERADGVLVYIPGFGAEGILLGLAGGDNDSFTQMNIIDVYDVATSSWYKQATSGPTPIIRVNPCAVVAAAADGSSYNVYMFAGQQLQPAGQQKQYNDMWILTVPSFTWIEVDMTDQSVPPGRSGHTCNIWDGQMVVLGGYVGPDLSCESPGVYVFNTSSLQWSNQYTSISDLATNPQSQQLSQLGDSTGLPGSYGYEVPAVVRAVVGGGTLGGAQVTAPSAAAAQGPLATGISPKFAVPNSGSGTGNADGTADNNSGTSGNGNNDTGEDSGSSGNGNSGRGPNVGAIVAGVIAGVFAIIAIYLGFVTWLYRKRLRQYKANVDRFGWEPSKGYNEVHSGVKAARPASSADLLGGTEPTFVGIMLHPKRSLRITNPD